MLQRYTAKSSAKLWIALFLVMLLGSALVPTGALGSPGGTNLCTCTDFNNDGATGMDDYSTTFLTEFSTPPFTDSGIGTDVDCSGGVLTVWDKAIVWWAASVVLVC